MKTSINSLRNKMLSAPYSTEIIAVMFEIARTGDPDAIPVLADQMDVPCDVRRAAVACLIEIGPAVIPEMRKRLEADDEDMIRNAHRVLAHFGDERSARAQYAVCWADFEEEEWRLAHLTEAEKAEERRKNEAAE
jgi:HEAT repeat protein